MTGVLVAEVAMSDNLVYTSAGEVELTFRPDGALEVHNYTYRKIDPDFSGLVFAAPAGRWKYVSVRLRHTGEPPVEDVRQEGV